MAAICEEMELNLDGDEGDGILENVPIFRYLVRALDHTDDDWPAVRRDIMRARSVWGRLGTLNSTGGGRSKGVGKFLQGGGAGDSIVWVGDVGSFGINGKEDRGEAHGVPTNDHGEENEAIRIWDMGDTGRIIHTRGRGNSVG